MVDEIPNIRSCRVERLGVVRYNDALELQRHAVLELQQGAPGRRGPTSASAASPALERLILLEHPHIFTLGRNADGAAIVAPPGVIRGRGAQLVKTDRGGDVTYHGPGQLVGYPIISLEPARRDIRRYVHDLEGVLIDVLADFDIEGRRDERNRGVWVGRAKIASLGIRIARWVTSHGFALNISTDLSYFDLITPCGITGCRMTSMAELLEAAPTMSDVSDRVVHHFSRRFGRTVSEALPRRTTRHRHGSFDIRDSREPDARGPREVHSVG